MPGVDETTPEEEQVNKEEAVEERKPSKASDDTDEAAKVKSNSYKLQGHQVGCGGDDQGDAAHITSEEQNIMETINNN